MSDVRIIAVSFEGGDQLHHVSHIWTAAGATVRQRAVEEVWARHCRYYTMSPSGRIDVATVPPRGPSLVAKLLRRRVRGHLRSETQSAGGRDPLLSLPRLPSPSRPRRSRAGTPAPGTHPPVTCR